MNVIITRCHEIAKEIQVVEPSTPYGDCLIAASNLLNSCDQQKIDRFFDGDCDLEEIQEVVQAVLDEAEYRLSKLGYRLVTENTGLMAVKQSLSSAEPGLTHLNDRSGDFFGGFDHFRGALRDNSC